MKRPMVRVRVAYYKFLVFLIQARSIMRGFWNWVFDFDEKPRWGRKLVNILLVLIAELSWVAFASTILDLTVGRSVLQDWSYFSALGIDKVALLSKSLGASLFYACVLAALWEEAAFRGWVIETCKRLFQGDRRALLYWVLLASILFGILHGGVVNIIFQGVGGLMLSYIYLKNGSCIWSAIIMHSLYNLVLILTSKLFTIPFLLHMVS